MSDSEAAQIDWRVERLSELEPCCNYRDLCGYEVMKGITEILHCKVNAILYVGKRCE